MIIIPCSWMFRNVSGCSMFLVLSTPPQLGIVQSSFQNFHNSKEIHRRIAPAASSNSFSKDNEKSQPQPQKKGRSSIIDSGDENRTLMDERDCFRSLFRSVCLLCLNDFSSHDIICILNEISKRFRFRNF